MRKVMGAVDTIMKEESGLTKYQIFCKRHRKAMIYGRRQSY